MKIDTDLARNLVRAQFPQWANLPIEPVAEGGWDNRTFHLGDTMSLRLPSAAGYVPQVDKEHEWLPKLVPHLPLEIPTPLAKGLPGCGYPWPWSIYKWIDGRTAQTRFITDMQAFAESLADFITSLHAISAVGGPTAGAHNFYRGGPLATYNAEVEQALNALGKDIDRSAVQEIWQIALASEWQEPPVWVHGDISIGNLLVQDGKLSAVIDFGCLGIGDPACDLVMTWTFFDDSTRRVFHDALGLDQHTFGLDQHTWNRARGWALWKALIVAAQLPGTDSKQRDQATLTINEIVFESGLES